MKKDNGRQGWGISGTNVLPFDRVRTHRSRPIPLGIQEKVQRTYYPWVGTYPPVLQVSEPYAEPLLS